MVLCMLSRGIGPLAPTIEAMQQAFRHGWGFEAILGKKLVDAKNHAVHIAIDRNQDLLLMEDDIHVPGRTWVSFRATLGVSDAILVAETKTRTGRSNIWTGPESGRFLFSGSHFVRIPVDVLKRLKQPIFRSWNFARTIDGEDMIDRGPAKHGNHSDVFFWFHAMKLEPKPQVAIVGECDHLKHPWNTGETSHADPYVAECY